MSVACTAALALGGIGERARPHVKRALQDSNTEKLAAVAVGRLGAAGVPLLPDLTRLWHKEGLAIRNAVNQGLTGLGELAIPHLRTLVDDAALSGWLMDYLEEADRKLARALLPELVELAPRAWFGSPGALSVLGRTGDPRALPVLIEAVEEFDHADAFLDGKTERAVRALGELGPIAAPALPAMLALLEEEHLSPRVAGFALRALGDIGVPSAPVIERLTQARTAGGKVGEDAKYALDVLRPDDTTPDWLLARSLRLHASDEVRIAALREMARRDPDEEAVKIFAKALDGSGELAIAVAEVLGDLGPKAKPALEALRSAADSKDEVRAAAAREALRKIEADR